MPRTPKSKPFLVLPLLENELSERSSPNIFDMPTKNPGLHLFTRTWPANKKPKETDENRRPLTATLEKPTILDIRLIGKIDMSKIRKEFLNISNLCRMPLLIKKSKKSKLSRPLSLPPTNLEKMKKVVEDSDISIGEESTKSVKVTGRHNSKLGQIEGKRNLYVCDNNNNCSKHFRTPRKNPTSISEKPALAIVPATNDSKSTKLPQPCKSCGRPDQPERLHSHPVTPIKNDTSPKLLVKSTVQKPFAIKYTSKAKAKPDEKIPSPSRKYSLPAQNLVHSHPSSAASTSMSMPAGSRANYKKNVSSTRAKTAKISLTCYICGREYGTHSLHLHEPKCLEKWERENAQLPKHLQRKAPLKPDHAMTKEEWNEKAWEAAQANLVPCENCGRTFYPDRLMVHLRSCKAKQKKDSIQDFNLLHYSVESIAEIRANPILSPQPPIGRIPPQNWQCYVCKKKLSGNSIKDHERQCLKKYRAEGGPDRLSDETVPSHPKVLGNKSPDLLPTRVVSTPESNAGNRPVSSKKPPLFPCYLCGKLFSVNSIYIHEPQCLKKWRIENEKLPPNKRRQEPQKPDIKFTNGKLSFAETQDANWQCHLSQLIPCKHCKRTFNPDRIEIHERSCRGA